MVVGDLHVLGALELASRLALVNADDRLDLLEALERLREPSAPIAGDPGDQDAALLSQTRPTFAWRSCRGGCPGSASGCPARDPGRAPCRQPHRDRRERPCRWARET